MISYIKQRYLNYKAERFSRRTDRELANKDLDALSAEYIKNTFPRLGENRELKDKIIQKFTDNVEAIQGETSLIDRINHCSAFLEKSAALAGQLDEKIESVRSLKANLESELLQTSQEIADKYADQKDIDHNEVVDQINRCTTLLTQLDQIKEKSPSLEGARTTILSIREGYQLLEMEMEAKLRNEARESKAEPKEKLPSLKESVAVLSRLEGQEAAELWDELIEDFLGVYQAVGEATPIDIEGLKERERELQSALAKATSPEETKALEGLQKVLQQHKKDHTDALLSKVELLNALSDAEIQTLADKNHGIRATINKMILVPQRKLGAEKLETLKIVMRLHHIFHNPFSPKLSLATFKKMVMDELDASLLAETASPLGLTEAQIEQVANAFTKIQLLDKTAIERIDNLSIGASNALSQDDLKAIHQQRKDCLKQLVTYNRERLARENTHTHTTIVGGGPGGTVRALMTALMGHNWSLVEKRDRSSPDWTSATRKNIVVLRPETAQILHYLGVYEDLLIHEQIHPMEDNLSVSIGDLENALTKALKAFERPGAGAIIQGEVRQIRTGKTDEQQQVTQVMTKAGNVLDPTDIIVASDGAGGATAPIMGMQRESLSTETLLFAVRTESPRERQEAAPFHTPHSAYNVIPLRNKEQKEIQKLQKKVADTTSEADKANYKKALNSYLDNLGKHYAKFYRLKGELVLSAPFRITISKSPIAAVQQGNALAVSSGDAYATPDPMSGSGCNTAIQSSIFLAQLLRHREGKEDTEALCHHYDEGMKRLYAEMIPLFFTGRDTYARGTETVAYLANQMEERGVFDATLTQKLKRIEKKWQHNVPYTKEENALLEQARTTVEGVENTEKIAARLEQLRISPLANHTFTLRPDDATATRVDSVVNGS